MLTNNELRDEYVKYLKKEVEALKKVNFDCIEFPIHRKEAEHLLSTCSNYIRSIRQIIKDTREKVRGY